MLYINLLGTPKIYLDEQLVPRFRTRKAQALLIYLAATNRQWSRDALATLFWPETDDASARKNLRDILPSLRRQIGEYLLLDDESIGLNPASPYQCDVSAFREVLERPTATVEIPTLKDTLQLYRGEFLEDYMSTRISADFELWAMRERERLHQLALIGFTTLCQQQQERGDYIAALESNQQLLKLAPWDEAAHRRQMRLLTGSGQRAAALAHFDICRRALADELDVEPDEETVQLYAQIKAGEEVIEPPATVAAPAPIPPPPAPAVSPAVRHNLPRQLTSLIGRTEEIDAVQRLLADEHTALLTLVGQGGVGKTRLALAVAQQLRRQEDHPFPDGIWFVALAGITPGENSTEQIAGAIAQAMDLSLTGSDPVAQQLIRALQAQQLLLVLDNFEQLVTEQSFLLELLQTAEQVKVLITARQPLQLHAEHLYPVVGLPVPAAADLRDEVEIDALLSMKRNTSISRASNGRNRAHTRIDLSEYASVQLFVTRVQQRFPEFRLTAENERNIGRVCRLLGGVPLGIELMAQLYVEQGTTILPQLIQEMEQLDPLEPQAATQAQNNHVQNNHLQISKVGLDHLQTPAIDLPPRQRSIRAVFEHSWRLLTPAEQQLLRHCAIFRGGFTRAAALAVADGDSASLQALVMKSLVRRDPNDRYDLHELVRQYVMDQFRQDLQLVHMVAHKHATYFVGMLAGKEEILFQQPNFHQRLQTEIFNIRAAWHWFTKQLPIDPTQIPPFAQAVPCFFHFLFLTSQRQEALTLAQQAMVAIRQCPMDVSEEATTQRLLGHLLSGAAEAAVRMEQREAVTAWANEAKIIGETLDDRVLLAQIYLTLAILDASAANHNQALFDIALDWAKQTPFPFLQALILLAAIPHWIMAPDTRAKAASSCKALLQLIHTHEYHYLKGDALIRQAMVFRSREEWGAAIQTTHAGLTACENHQGSTYTIRVAHEVLGQIYIQMCDFSEAQRWALAAYQQSKIHGNQLSVLNNLYSLSLVHVNFEAWAKTESYLRELVSLAEEIGATQFIVLGYMGLGQLRNRQALYHDGIVYYQKALQVVSQANYPSNRVLIISGIAVAHLHLGQHQAAYQVFEPLFAHDLLFSFNNRQVIHLAFVAYQVLDGVGDPRAEDYLERSYTLLQGELAKLTDPALRTAYDGYRNLHHHIIETWEAHRIGKRIGKSTGERV